MTLVSGCVMKVVNIVVSVVLRNGAAYRAAVRE